MDKQTEIDLIVWRLSNRYNYSSRYNYHPVHVVSETALTLEYL